MHVQIALDSPHSTWTNLDVLHGKILVRIFSPTPLSSIVVKLEGESRTRLQAAPRSGPGHVDGGYEDWRAEKPMVREETHKILYKTATVFPGQQTETQSPTQRSLTLNPGSYEFPFSFKFPFNNACREAAPSAASGLAQIARLGLKGSTPNTPHLRHVKKTLPPTLTTFPGVAEIRYYVKVTVNRKEFYKENPRVMQNLNFFPIEPPRLKETHGESYARRQHQFVQSSYSAIKGKTRLRDVFKKSSASIVPDSDSTIAPLISVDARLPNPAIITCNEDLPLQLGMKRLDRSSDQLFLQSLHIQLHGTTRIKADEIFRNESSNWVLVSKSNMAWPLNFQATDEMKNGAEEHLIIDAGLWRKQPLPNSISPTFETCNISRSYELEIQIGLGFGSEHAKNTVILPLKHAVQVYSGIAPPAALLAAMRNSRIPPRKPVQTSSRPPEKTVAFTAPAHLRTDNSAIPSTSQAGPSTPIETPVEQQPTQFGPLPAGEEEPPPSYEDAVAQELPPIDGQRREYQPPPIGAGGFSDDKQRRDS